MAPLSGADAGNNDVTLKVGSTNTGKPQVYTIWVRPRHLNRSWDCNTVLSPSSPMVMTVWMSGPIGRTPGPVWGHCSNGRTLMVEGSNPARSHMRCHIGCLRSRCGVTTSIWGSQIFPMAFIIYLVLFFIVGHYFPLGFVRVPQMRRVD